ncbi:MAG: tRNA preQ1(34) S-adenosylmethionine ribosyltransferase-isomerase QueA [Bacteroidaceae bacterium]|nr:tRNA preQ1(34) S-adenosylmethionine ribosyltransferase-isomerase QueA [Bacteroidaceae bacterium]
MKLSRFKFKLPEDKLALHPAYNRDEAKMMIIHKKSGKIEMFETDENGETIKDEDGKPVYIQFKKLINYFDENDTIIFNDSKIFPSRIYGMKEKTDAQIEVLLLRELNSDMRLWDVLVEPARKIRIGNKLFFNESGSMVAEVVDNTTSRGRTLRFLYDSTDEDFRRELYSLGEVPVPHYIVDKRPMEEEDAERYQTLYAKNEGAIVVPASGLHFSRELLKRLEIKGVNFAYVTVHTSLGCFHTIEVEDLSKFKMDSEKMVVDAEACRIVNETKKYPERKILCVGPSTFKAIETAKSTSNTLKEYNGWTNRFMFPPYESGVANCMVCNFYYPETTLLMAEAAFAGYELIMEAYKLALKNDYMFGVYGDCMLVLND